MSNDTLHSARMSHYLTYPNEQFTILDSEISKYCQLINLTYEANFEYIHSMEQRSSSKDNYALRCLIDYACGNPYSLKNLLRPTESHQTSTYMMSSRVYIQSYHILTNNVI